MSLRIKRQLGACVVIAALVVGDEALAAGADPFHRPPQPEREPGNDRLLGIVLAFVAEAAADVGRDQADRGLRQAELFGDDAADVVRHLGRDIKRQLAGVAVGQHRARLDRRADQAVVDEVEPHHMGGTLQCLAHRGVIAALEAEAGIAGCHGMHLRRAGAQRLARIHHRGQHLIIHRDRVGGVLRLRPRFGDHRSQSLADVADRAARQRKAVGLGHRLTVGRFDRP